MVQAEADSKIQGPHGAGVQLQGTAMMTGKDEEEEVIGGAGRKFPRVPCHQGMWYSIYLFQTRLWTHLRNWQNSGQGYFVMVYGDNASVDVEGLAIAPTNQPPGFEGYQVWADDNEEAEQTWMAFISQKGKGKGKGENPSDPTGSSTVETQETPSMTITGGSTELTASTETGGSIRNGTPQVLAASQVAMPNISNMVNTQIALSMEAQQRQLMEMTKQMQDSMQTKMLASLAGLLEQRLQAPPQAQVVPVSGASSSGENSSPNQLGGTPAQEAPSSKAPPPTPD